MLCIGKDLPDNERKEKCRSENGSADEKKQSKEEEEGGKKSEKK